jgi:hypothetical protein
MKIMHKSTTTKCLAHLQLPFHIPLKGWQTTSKSNKEGKAAYAKSGTMLEITSFVDNFLDNLPRGLVVDDIEYLTITQKLYYLGNSHEQK